MASITTKKRIKDGKKEYKALDHNFSFTDKIDIMSISIANQRTQASIKLLAFILTFQQICSVNLKIQPF